MKPSAAIAAFALCSLFLLKSAEAETRTRFFADGDWTVDLVGGLTMKDGRYTGQFDNMCVAETARNSVKLSFVMNAGRSSVSEEFKKNIYLQLSSPSWKFPFLEEPLLLLSTSQFYAGNAWFFDDVISLNVSVDDDLGLMDFAQTAGGKVSVIAGNGKTREFEESIIVLRADDSIIANLSTKGLKSAYPKLLECAGQKN